MDALIREAFKQSLRNAFNIYGVEHTEEVIKDIWKNCPHIQNQYLEVYKELLAFKK